jgi:glyoxylase-like metal-dependent hydrolase (beta-lactamase superfamily II)
MSGNIQLHVFVSPYKPIVSVLPSWDAAQQATWPASSVSLLTGEREAVLIDALATQTEAERVVDWVRAMGKDLKTVYITHAHGDHFFGLNTILTAFPAAKAVALPEVVPLAREQAGPGGLAFWNALFPDQLPQNPRVPEPMQGGEIELEGHVLRPISIGQSDTAPSSVVHVPDLGAVVGGDVAYNGIHCWLAQTDHTKREGWIASLDKIAALDPGIVVAGHKAPDARDDDPQTILATTKTYIRDFDTLVTQCRTPKELIDRMMQLHGERGNPYTLWTAAYGVADQLPK